MNILRDIYRDFRGDVHQRVNAERDRILSTDYSENELRRIIKRYRVQRYALILPTAVISSVGVPFTVLGLYGLGRQLLNNEISMQTVFVTLVSGLVTVYHFYSGHFLEHKTGFAIEAAKKKLKQIQNTRNFL